jgi:hypothetical protein
VVCPDCGGTGLESNRDMNGHPVPVPRGTPNRRACWMCDDGAMPATLVPGSLAALKIALADAVDRNWLRAKNYELIELIGEHLDAIINHSDYALATPNTEEKDDA